jgi:dienelactone hydrolase
MLPLAGWILTPLALWLFSVPLSADEVATVPGTTPLDWEGELDIKMMDGLHRYIERKIAQSIEDRERFWRRDFSSPEAYEKSVEPNRERLQKILGIVDRRVAASMERFGDDDSPALVAKTDHYCVYQVRWPVLEGVTGEGLLLEPSGNPIAQVVALPDADQTPEQLTGLAPGISAPSQFARRLAEAGFRVVVPTLIDRSDEWSGHADVGWTNQPHREWIYRQAYMMGRHVIGYEVQKVLAAVDWFKHVASNLKVGVIGYGEGGLVAMDAAAADPRIDACTVSGYFDSRQESWKEPLYRNMWGFLVEFDDAETASLIAPRGLVVEYSRAPEITGPPKVRSGRRRGAAVGEIHTPAYDSVRREFERIESLLRPGFQKRQLIATTDGTAVEFGSQRAVEEFARLLGVTKALPDPVETPIEQRKAFSPADRQRRQVKELENHVQGLIRAADRTRERFFTLQAAPDYQQRRRQWTTSRTVPTWPAEPFIERARPFKRYFWEEVLGKLADPPLPLNPRSRKIYDREKWASYEVVLDVRPDIFAWGILLVPKDLKPGEKRPVVVCQHGRNGLPAKTIEREPSAYNGVSALLADRGYIVFAPHNPYRGEDRYRILSRKANGLKASLFSFILAQHEQILQWLGSLPYVDAKRIAFYGCSYGGETAVRVPPLLDGYCLSICSSDFNDWARKVASTDSPFSFMFTEEWEMPYFNLGSTFNYAEMAYLMIPRPLMVERGHCDTVAPDEWVASEYGKVRWMYDMLGLGDRTEIEFFTGGHCFHCERSFEFLDKHLRRGQ